MTLVVVLLFGFGALLVISSIETDPTTGKSVSVLQTIGDVWNNRVDFSQPSAEGGGGSAGSFAYQPPSPSTTTLAANQTYQQAVVASYLKSRAL